MADELNGFDPDDTGVSNGNYFGFPFSTEEARLILISVPWDVTSSYGGGSSSAPDAIIEASVQLDFHDPLAPGRWKQGIATAPIDYSIQERSLPLREDAVRIMEHLESGMPIEEGSILYRKLERINTISDEINTEIYDQSLSWLAAGKLIGLVGGDHSTPYGLIRAIAEKEGAFGILHIDAHCDLREKYEGFSNSHASIMYNVLRDIPEVVRLVQVGVRDYAAKEIERVRQEERIVFFPDHKLCDARFRGECWGKSVDRIVEKLPEKVYISFDIDGLSPENCPHTGTPVPGGLSFNEAIWLIARVVDSGRKIVGFDLCEVAPGKDNQWDANVGARVLFKLCGQTIRSNE